MRNVVRILRKRPLMSSCNSIAFQSFVASPNIFSEAYTCHSLDEHSRRSEGTHHDMTTSITKLPLGTWLWPRMFCNYSFWSMHRRETIHTAYSTALLEPKKHLSRMTTKKVDSKWRPWYQPICSSTIFLVIRNEFSITEVKVYAHR